MPCEVEPLPADSLSLRWQSVLGEGCMKNEGEGCMKNVQHCVQKNVSTSCLIIL